MPVSTPVIIGLRNPLRMNKILEGVIGNLKCQESIKYFFIFWVQLQGNGKGAD